MAIKLPLKNKKPDNIIFLQRRGLNQKNGGFGGIRTPEGLPPTRFPGVRLKPLGHETLLALILCVLYH